jgi:hypothetical protein
MKPVALKDRRLTATLVQRWANQYCRLYDNSHYFPWITSARQGNRHALERITEWKNVGFGACPRPMRLSANKQTSLRRLFHGLPRYLSSGGRAALESDFMRHAPVYSIFWSHVLYDSPIFDAYTRVAFEYFCAGKRFSKTAARIAAPHHWALYSPYEKWFSLELRRLRATAPKIDGRMFDQALFEWGKYYCS